MYVIDVSNSFDLSKALRRIGIHFHELEVHYDMLKTQNTDLLALREETVAYIG